MPDINDIIYVGDLIYYNNSLLTLFHDKRYKLIIHRWCDLTEDRVHNIYLTFYVELHVLEDYFNKKITEYDFIKLGESFLITDYVLKLTFENIPLNYLPDKSVYLDTYFSNRELIKNFIKIKKMIDRKDKI